ncbi:MAG: hypothetical protein R3F13_18320 [Prosthecobacter sp.]
MKKHPLLLLVLVLASCAGMMNSHRMKAAQRKMLDTRTLQQAGQWEDALAMADRMHSSVSKSVTAAPMHKTASGAEVDLRPLLAAWTNGPLTELRKALKKHDSTGSTKAFASLRQQCVNCHTVLGTVTAEVSELP